MSQPPKMPVVQSKAGKASPHGRADFWCEGRRLFGTAEGPFNLEMARYVEQQIVDWCRTMRADGPFDHLCVFKTSVLLGPDAMRHFQSMLKRLNEDAIAPQRMAYVMAPDVEGGGFLAPQLTNAYGSAGITMRIFASLQLAIEWLDAE